MFVANRYQIIKNYEDTIEVNEEMVEKLDKMLTENGVQHFFSLPAGDENGCAINDDEVVYVYYDADIDDMTFKLVYMLWAKTVRHIKDEKIVKAMKTITEKAEQ